jgi:hypothetical protein
MKKLIVSFVASAAILSSVAEEYANLFTGGTLSFSTGGGPFIFEAACYPKKIPLSNNANNLVDGNSNTFTTFDMTTTLGTYVAIDYTFSDKSVKANAYTIQAGPANGDGEGSNYLYEYGKRGPKSFSFYGYDPIAEAWELLDTREGGANWGSKEERTFKFINEKAYSAYRLTVNRNDQLYIGFSELKLHWIDTSDVLTVESDKENFGTPSPAYGANKGLTLGAMVTCTIDANGVYSGSDGGKYVFRGYELYAHADTGTPQLMTSGSENTVTYQHSVNTKLVWKWEAAPLYVSKDGTDDNDGYGPTSAKATLTAAINAAIDGQMIIVQDGDYAISSQLSITKNVHVVSANGPEKTIIHGAGTHQLLTLNNSSAIVEGISWTNGYCSVGTSTTLATPTGVLVTKGTLKDCVVTKCRSVGYGAVAVAVNGADAHVIGGKIIENTSEISSTGKGSPYSLCGAGLYISNGRVEDVLIADNRGGSAVGVYQTGGTVKNCQILRNVGSSEQTLEIDAMGGKESAAWGTVLLKGGTMTGCRIADNVAASAAGAYVFGSGKLENSTVACNRATLDLPLTVWPGDIASSILADKRALQPALSYRRPIGGVILGGADASVTGCTIVSNRAERCGSEQGLYQFAGTAANNTFEANGEDENTSKSTSFVAYVVPDDGQKGEWPYDTREKAARSIQDAVDAVAATREQPGTVYVAAGEYVSSKTMALLVKRPVHIVAEGLVRLVNDGSTSENRLGLWLADSSAAVSGIELSGFYSAGYGDSPCGRCGWVGALVYAGELTKCSIVQSKSKNYNGCASLMMINGKVSHCRIANNNAANVIGGVKHRGNVVVYGGVIEDSSILNNYAMNGAGILAYGETARIKRCVVSGNCVKEGNENHGHPNPGAGVYLRAGAVVENTLIVSNVVEGAAVGSGAGVYMSGGKLINCTVADNVNKLAGKTSGVQQDGGEIINCIIWRNGNGGEYTEALNFAQKAGTETVTTSLTNVDPLFKDGGMDIYRLRQNSPAINAGTTGDWTAEDKDILGNSRVFNRIIDIGAYEYQLRGFRLIVR